MKNVAILALFALPLVACGGAVEDERSVDGNVGTEQSELANPPSGPTQTPTISTTFLINFDVDPSGSPLADGTIIDSLFTSSRGVTFSSIVCTPGSGCANDHAYARASTLASSLPNVVANFATGVPLLNAKYGAVRADFTTERTWVSIEAAAVPYVADATDVPTALPWLEAYDSSNTLIGRMYYPIPYGGTNYGSYQTLTVNAGSARIKWIRFSSQGGTPEVFGRFDNLRFNGELPRICLYRVGC